MIFAHGNPLRKVPQDELVDDCSRRSTSHSIVATEHVEAAEAREGADWLARIEEENAGEITPDASPSSRRRPPRPVRPTSPARRSPTASRT